MKYLIYIFFFFLWGVSAQASLAVTQKQLDQSLEKHIRYHAEGPNTIGYLEIGGHETSITQGTWVYVKKALDFYKNNPPAFLILKLNTPGGQVFAAQKISDALKEMDTQYDIPVVAFIDNWAISAGAMLAYSCRYIFIVKDASMGARQPVPQSGETTSEKVNSAIRTDFANRAAFFDRNPLIAEAMVDPDLILVLREGKIVRLLEEKQIEERDDVITQKGKLLTLSAQEMQDWGVADFRLLPAKLSPITEEEKESGSWPAEKELLFTYPFFQKIPQARIVTFNVDWKTQFFMFLSSPLVSSLLFLGLMLSLYIELSTPGFGIAGIFGILCLFFILLSGFALQAIHWLEIILLIGGLALIFVEIFVLPGFGIIGILGIGLALIGLFAILLPELKEVTFDFDTKTLNAAGNFLLERLAWLGATFVIGVLSIALLARFIAPRLALYSPLVLRGEQEKNLGYVAGKKEEDLPPIGSLGRVLSPLRTAGKVEIEEKIYDAVSNGSFVEEGRKVRVVEVKGSKLIVEEVE